MKLAVCIYIYIFVSLNTGAKLGKGIRCMFQCRWKWW